jgi:dGTPase
MADHGGFDHNQHSYRIITELERRYEDFPGLNLTYEFREGIIKHETEYDSVSAPPGFESGLRGTLESQIASFADELAYNAHDLDDGLRAGLLTERDVEHLAWWRCAQQSAGVEHEVFTDVTRHRTIRRLIGLMVTDLLTATSSNIARMLANTSDATVEDVRRWPEVLAGYTDQAVSMNRELKPFLLDRLYFHPRVIRMTHKAERVLTDLFSAYTDEARMLPEGARNRLAVLPLHRVVCDYIAGMTDRFALDEHARLFDPRERV